MISLKVFHQQISRLLLAGLFLIPFMIGIASPVAASAGSPGAVYTLSNASSGNQILVYDRASDGTLSYQGAYDTGGLGSGAGLGSQGAVILSRDNRWLFAVNAGSNQVSVFMVKSDGLVLTDTTSSGGTMPISLTARDRILYVLNAGDSGNISGLRVSPGGKLTPIAGSTRPLSNHFNGPAPAAAQVSFSPDGESLVVTEKSTNLIDTYRVDDDRVSGPRTHPSSGATPFGFAFNRRGYLVVSEAFGGAAGLSAASSYKIDDNHFRVISPSVGTTQTAACWVAISKNGQFAYTANAGSGTISGYRIASDGSLTLQNAAAVATGNASSHPIDMAFSNDGSFLYALNSVTNTISAFQEMSDGSLGPTATFSVNAGAAGLAAR